MHIESSGDDSDDGLDALVERLNRGFERLALTTQAPYADHLSVRGNRLTIRRRPAASLHFEPPPAQPEEHR